MRARYECPYFTPHVTHLVDQVMTPKAALSTTGRTPISKELGRDRREDTTCLS